MPLTLPPILAAMVAAHNAHDPAAFTACFSEDAVVRDEGMKHCGRPAIREWFEDVSRKYRAVLNVTSLSTMDGEPVLSGQVSGDFEGSPLSLRYFLALDEGRIVALKIAA
jgi:hypothetical protein